MPLFWLSLTFLGGIVLAAVTSLPSQRWLWLAGVSITLLGLVSVLKPMLTRRGLPAWPLNRLSAGVIFHRHIQLPVPIFTLLAILCLGAFRYAVAQPDLTDPTFVASYNDDEAPLVLEGVLVKPPDVRDRTINLRIQVERIFPDQSPQPLPSHGLILARLTQPGAWHYGDLLRLQGNLVTPPVFDDFSYRDYLTRQGIYAYMPNAQAELIQPDQGNLLLASIYAAKERFQDMIYRLYPDPEASLLNGILIGAEGGIPPPVRQAFNDTGTAHIIAISGFNITILAGLFSAFFSRIFGRWRGAMAAVLCIGAYTILVGADAAVVRAALMGGLTVFARQLGRRQHGLNSLAFVAAVMALFNPYVLWDVGFQLSFAATLGLVLYAEPFTNSFVQLASRATSLELAQRLAGLFGEYLLFTLAAQLTTLPIILYYFKRLSLISLAANPVILPVQPPVMTLGGLAVLAGMIYLPLGQAAATLAWPFVAFTIRAVEFFHRFQGGALTLGEAPLPTVLGIYLLLFLITFGWLRVKNLLPALKPGLALLLLGAVTITLWKAVLSAPDGRLHLYLLETNSGASSGEALLVQTPSGRFILIDGGPSPSLLSDALGRRLPASLRRLDWLVVAGSKENQLAALPQAMQRYPPQRVLWAAPPASATSARYLKANLTQAGVPLITPQVGQSLTLGEGANLTILAMDDYGATLLLTWGNFCALLPVGLDYRTLEELQDDPRLAGVTALLLADRGREWLNPSQWIAKLRPQVVLLNVAAADWDAFPPPETLQALQGYNLLRTDRNGWIHLSTDGEIMWVEVERR